MCLRDRRERYRGKTCDAFFKSSIDPNRRANAISQCCCSWQRMAWARWKVLGLRLEDLDWRAGVLRARRPKTDVRMELPLLPAVARALTAYLRWERPVTKATDRLFLRKSMPYAPITTGGSRFDFVGVLKNVWSAARGQAKKARRVGRKSAKMYTAYRWSQTPGHDEDSRAPVLTSSTPPAS